MRLQMLVFYDIVIATSGAFAYIAPLIDRCPRSLRCQVCCRYRAPSSGANFYVSLGQLPNVCMYVFSQLPLLWAACATLWYPGRER